MQIGNLIYQMQSTRLGKRQTNLTLKKNKNKTKQNQKNKNKTKKKTKHQPTNKQTHTQKMHDSFTHSKNREFDNF